jgi:hypothetical protein
MHHGVVSNMDNWCNNVAGHYIKERLVFCRWFFRVIFLAGAGVTR